MLAVDTAGAGHLLPGLELATHAPPRGASWFISIFMLGALLGAPLLARIATSRGRTTVLAASLATFALASFVVGLSSSYPLTLAARFVQGIAGSPVMPLGAAHLSALAPAGKKGRGLGLLSLSYSGGFLAGMAFVSLFLLVSFRLAYLFTGTLAFVASIAVARLPTASGATAEAHRPSPEVSTILGWFLALALLAFAVNQANVGDMRAVRVAQLAAAPALALFVWRDRAVRAPLLPRDLFHSRAGIASALLALAAGVGQACVVLLPTCGMAELGVSAAASGPLLIPIVLGGLGTNLLASARLDRWGPRPFLAAGLLGMAVGNLITASLGTNLLFFEVGALLLGAGVSAMSSGALRYLATLHGAPDDADANQAAISLLTNVGVLFGGSLWGAIVPSSAGIGVAAVRSGVFVLTAAFVPLSIGVLLVPSRR